MKKDLASSLPAGYFFAKNPAYWQLYANCYHQYYFKNKNLYKQYAEHVQTND